MNHRWNNKQTVRLIETPDLEPHLDVDPARIPEVLTYVEAVDFETEFLIVTELVFQNTPHTYAIRDDLWGDGAQIVVDGHRTSAETGDTGTVVSLIRVTPGQRSIPPVARVVYEREQPQDGGDTWSEFKNYPDDGKTAVSLLMETGEGDFVMQVYPSTLTAGQPQQFVVMVANNEQPVGEYTVVTQLQQVEKSDGSVTVTQRERLTSSPPRWNTGNGSHTNGR